MFIDATTAMPREAFSPFALSLPDDATPMSARPPEC
jgi:hypothetical protein